MNALRRVWEAAWRLKLWWMTPLALAAIIVILLLLTTSGSVDVPFRYLRY
jgi:hypothetical protein